MSSWQSQVVKAVLRLSGRKRRLASARAVRDRVERLRRHPAPHRPAGQKAPYTMEHNAYGWPVYQVGHASARRVIYLHGGCYINEIVRRHWLFIGNLARQARAQVTVPIYRLAPHATAAATVPAVAALIAGVLDEGGRWITVIGDSAGGGLALAAAQLLRDSGREQPDALVLIAPWLDLSMTHPALPRLRRRDAMLDIDGLAEAGRLYAGELGVRHPFASPVNGGFDRLAPITVFTGTHDLLLPDTLALQGRATIHLADGMQHVYPLLPVPEARPACNEIVRIVSG